MSTEDKVSLAALHKAGAEHVSEDDVVNSRAHDERFPNAIYLGSGNGYSKEVTFGVRRRLAPFPKLQFELNRRIEGSQAEHTLIVQAILDWDGEANANTVRDHILIIRPKVDEAATGPEALVTRHTR